MSFYTYAPSPGVLTARELEIIRSVYDRVISTDGFPADDQEARREIALYALSMYQRGMTVPEKLERLCLQRTQKIIDGSGDANDGPIAAQQTQPPSGAGSETQG